MCNKIMTFDQCCKFLDIPASELDEIINKRGIPFSILPSKYKYNSEDYRRFIESEVINWLKTLQHKGSEGKL